MKGTAIRAGVAWFATAFGAAALREVAERASPALATILSPGDPSHGIIASGWYDVPLVGELLELMETVAAPEDSDQYTQQLTTAIARDNVSGIYRSLFRLITTPPLLEQNAQRVWQTYYDEGTLTAVSPRPGELSFVLRGQTVHHGKLCRVTCATIQNVLRALGYTGLVMERTQCLSDGSNCCAFEGIYLV